MTEPSDFYLYRTKDPESPIGAPAATTLLYKVCDHFGIFNEEEA